MADRYKIVDESQSVHCCFRKTVVDTTRPVMIHGEHYDGKYEPMCECIDEEAAPVICDALNAVDRFRWIPVSERLPERDWDGFSPIVVVAAGNSYFLGRYYKCELGDECHECDFDLGERWYIETIREPTHWMPLPEPPEVTR